MKLPTAPALLPGAGVLNVMLGLMNLPLALIAGLYAGFVARRARAGHVLSVMDDGFSVIAGALAARVSGAPHVVWVFDLWQENAYPAFSRWLAGRVEGPLLRGAAVVLVHAEETAVHLRRKHGVDCTALATPVDLSRTPEPALRGRGGASEVLISGAVYWAQEDAVLRLARVCARIEGVRLTLLAPSTLLKVEQLEGARIEPGLPESQVAARLVAADILFLGLSFDTRYPDVIRTATPARLPEYMASGVPILVHAPAGSHVTEYARSRGFATVVDRPDETALEQAVRELLSNREKASARARVARELAETRHDVSLVCGEFTRALAATRSSRGA